MISLSIPILTRCPGFYGLTDYQTLTASKPDALVGYYTEPLGGITSKLQIPYFLISAGSRVEEPHVFHLMPDTGDIVACMLDLIRYYDWKQVAIMYEQSLRK